MASTLRNLFLTFAGAALLAPAAWGQTASLVRDINTTTSVVVSSSPEELLTVGDKLFFLASQGFSARELWVSDGSGIGTQMLGDVCTAFCPDGPMLLGSTGGVLLFMVLNGEGFTTQVWRSDGTRKGTFALRSTGSIPLYGGGKAVYVGGVLLFHGCTVTLQCQTWRSDGTLEGTEPLKEVSATGLVAAGGKAYLLTSDPALWVSDGTDAGTQKVRDLPPNNFPSVLTPAGNRVFFVEGDGHGDELWTSDGTAAGTRAVTNFPNDRPFTVTEGLKLKVIGDHVYFLADDGIHGTEIWRSDGTPETTRQVTKLDFRSPFDGSTMLSHMEEVGSRLLFVATDGLTPAKLWTTSGSPGSTAPLPCAGGCPDLFEVRLIKVGGRVLFGGTDSAHGRELWSTDGTAAGTTLIQDICPGSCSGLVNGPEPFAGTSFFVATMDQPSPSRSFELWTSDGTAAGTRRFADPASGFQTFQTGSIEIAALGSTLFFPGYNSYGIELWASDGNPGGTRLVTDVARGGPSSAPQNLAALGDQLLFTACDGLLQNIWK